MNFDCEGGHRTEHGLVHFVVSKDIKDDNMTGLEM